VPDITIAAPDAGAFGAYLALPPGGSGPGLVVIQEIFGVNAVMRAITDDYARQGYVVLCPDLFWRQEPGIQITDRTEAEWERAFALFGGFDRDKGIEDLAATLAHLRGLPACSGKVGSVGYCLGGMLAFLMGTRTDSDANVSYYGVGLDGLLDEAGSIRRPMLLHLAEKDRFVPPEAQAKIRAGLSGHALVTLHAYPGVDHAFARRDGAHFDATAAGLANERTAAFLDANLT